MTTASLLWGVLFSSMGVGFLIYGKRQGQIVPFVSGVALVLCPMIIENSLALVSISAVLVSLPYFLRL